MSGEVVIDANLAVLFFVGMSNRAYIQKHKRLVSYDALDFDILCGEIGKFTKIIFTPNMLSEASNLLRQTYDPVKSHICATMARIVGQVEEKFVDSRTAVLREEYPRLGLTDSVLLEVLHPGATLLTADLHLYLAASSAGFSAINYRHIQRLRPDLQ